MHYSEELLPRQKTDEYVQEQKENHEYPLHKSGLELTASIANITSEAMLITQGQLIHEPEIFEKRRFNKEREYILQHSEEDQEFLLEELALNLTPEYKEKLRGSIDSFLSDYETYAMKKPRDYRPIRFKVFEEYNKKIKTNGIYENKLKRNFKKSGDKDYDEIKYTLFTLLSPEVDIQNAFEVYRDMAFFLTENGMEMKIFDDMMGIMVREGRRKYTMH